MKTKWTLGFVFCLFSTLCSYPVFAASVEEAGTLYAKRGMDEQGVENAKKAAEMYQVLSTTASSDEEKAYFLIKESEAHYFVGLVQQRNGSPENVVLEGFDKGYKAGLIAVNLLGSGFGNQYAPVYSKKTGNEKFLSLAMYWEVVNLWNWAKVMGYLQKLAKLKEVIQPRLVDILRLDDTTHGNGGLHLAGEIYLWLPGHQEVSGNNSLELLSKAYTRVGSDDIAGAYFYLKALMDAREEDTFCLTYADLQPSIINADSFMLAQMFPGQAPEAQMKHEKLVNDQELSKYYVQKCE